MKSKTTSTPTQEDIQEMIRKEMSVYDPSSFSYSTESDVIEEEVQ